MKYFVTVNNVETFHTLINFYHFKFFILFNDKLQFMIAFTHVSNMPEEQVNILVNVEPCYVTSYSVAAVN